MTAAFALGLLLAAPPAPATSVPPNKVPAHPAPAPNLAALKRDLDTIAQRFGGRLGYYLKDLTDGRTIGFRQDERFPTASTIKTAVMVEAVRQVDAGKRKWTDKIPVPPRAERTGNMQSMWSYYLQDGIAPDLDGWNNLMIGVSDNTATKVLGTTLGNASINASMTALGLPNTKFLAYAPAEDVTLRRLNRQFGMGMTTPREMNRLMELIATGRAASPAGCDRMLRILKRQYWDDAIGSSVPPSVAIANKTGAISRSRSDAAVVYGPRPYVLTLFTDHQKDRRWAADNEGDLTLARMAARVWRAMNPGVPGDRPAGAEKFAPTGGGV